MELQRAKAVQSKKKRKQNGIHATYPDTGPSATSAFITAFTLSSCMKLLYDISYDVCLNLRSVGTGFSGWQKGRITQDCAKLMHVQALLEPNTSFHFSDDDSKVLGKQVILWCLCVCCQKNVVVLVTFDMYIMWVHRCSRRCAECTKTLVTCSSARFCVTLCTLYSLAGFALRTTKR